MRTRSTRAAACAEATELRPHSGAIREQLGVRLQRKRAPVEVLVIEHVVRPSEN